MPLACGTGTYGENCANNCACGVGANRCDSVSGCVCSSGWIGSRCDQDIDECQTLSVVQECQNKNAKCINFPGNYSCDCETGYQQNPSGICEGEIIHLLLKGVRGMVFYTELAESVQVKSFFFKIRRR